MAEQQEPNLQPNQPVESSNLESQEERESRLVEEILEGNEVPEDVVIPKASYGYVEAFLGSEAEEDLDNETVREAVNEDLRTEAENLVATGTEPQEAKAALAHRRLELLQPRSYGEIEKRVEEFVGGRKDYEGSVAKLYEFLRLQSQSEGNNLNTLELSKEAMDKLVEFFNEFRQSGDFESFHKFENSVLNSGLGISTEDAVEALYRNYGRSISQSAYWTKGRLFGSDQFERMLRLLAQERDWKERVDENADEGASVGIDLEEKRTEKDEKLDELKDEYVVKINRLLEQWKGLGVSGSEQVKEKFKNDLQNLRGEIEQSGKFGKELAIAESEQAAQLDRALKVAVAKIEGKELKEENASPFLTPESDPVPKEVEEARAQALEYQDRATEWKQQVEKALNEHHPEEARKVLDVWKKSAESLAERIMSLDRQGIRSLMELFGSDWEKVRQKGKELTDSLDWAEITVAYLERHKLLESYHPMVRQVVEETRKRAWEEFKELNRSKAPSQKALDKIFDEYWQEDQLSVIMAVENKLKAKGLIK